MSRKGLHRVGKLKNNDMKNFNKISILLVLVTVLLYSCSKSDDTPAAANFTPALKTTDLTTRIPTSLATKSPKTSEQIDGMIAFMGLAESLQQTKPAGLINQPNNNGTSSRGINDSWTSGEYTINYTGSDSATQHLYTYTISQGSTTFYTINGWENIDGSAGHWVFDITAAASSGQGTISIDFDWIKNSTNDYNLDMVIAAGAESGHLIATINHNNSGNMTGYTTGTTLEFKSTWNANGSGQYIDYTTNPATTTNY